MQQDKSNSRFTPADSLGIRFNPFQSFDFSNFESFNSFASAKEQFSADNFFGEESKTFEFSFFSTITEEVFSEFKDFFVTEIFPKLKKGSFLKFNFFSNNDKFEFSQFNNFFNQFSDSGVFFEMSFFSVPDNFNFSDFEFPFNFNGDFTFSVRRAFIR